MLLNSVPTYAMIIYLMMSGEFVNHKRGFFKRKVAYCSVVCEIVGKSTNNNIIVFRNYESPYWYIMHLW